jgi:hypothetical protein
MEPGDYRVITFSIFLEGCQIEDRRHDGGQDRIAAVRVAAILGAAIKAVFIASLKTLAEVVVVFTLSYIISVVAVVRVLVSVGGLIAGVPPMILAVCLPRLEPLFIAVVHSLPE